MTDAQKLKLAKILLSKTQNRQLDELIEFFEALLKEESANKDSK